MHVEHDLLSKMTTLIDASELLTGTEAVDQEPVVVAARSIEKLVKEQLGEDASKAFERDFMALKKAENWQGLFSLMLKNEKVVFARLAAVVASGDEQSARMLERMAEGYFTVVIFLLEQFDTEESVNLAVAEFCKVIAGSAADEVGSKVRLRLLMILHNVFRPGTSFRQSVMNVIDGYASQSTQLKHFLKSHSVLRAADANDNGMHASMEAVMMKKVEALVEQFKKTKSLPLKSISENNSEAIEVAIRAIRSGMITAEIDQVNGVLVASAEVSPKKSVEAALDLSAFQALLEKMA